MPPARCPICDKFVEPDSSPAFPFCSHRCRQIDLGRWLGEGYSVPHEGRDDDLEERPSPEAEGG